MSELTEEIKLQICRCGKMAFPAFMHNCLYHSSLGYYMTERQRIGRSGDFFTSSSVHVLFGTLVARQIAQMWQIIGNDGFVLVEQGGGEGHLALDILDTFQREFPQRYARLNYWMVETSPIHVERQRMLLHKHHERVAWFSPDSLPSFTGCLLSNELLDALPVHIVEECDGHLLELYVDCQNGELVETLGELSTSAIEEHFAWLGLRPLAGARAEVNLAALRWLEESAARLERGFILTIDYGHPAAELYAPWRRNGTLMCYHRHTSSENPLERCGEQDITSHVDFTALQLRGAELGLENLYFAEQYRFLIALGFVEELLQLQARETDERRAQALRMTLKHLIMPESGGMGEAFKVLIQAKGLGRPQLLCERSVSDVARHVVRGAH